MVTSVTVRAALKSLVATHLPGVYAVLRDAKARATARARQLTSVRHRFTAIYHQGGWGSAESLSGPGSTFFETAVIRKEIPLLIERLAIRSLVDVPCGDFNWMQYADLALERYVGADVVGALIQSNRTRFGDAGRAFIVLDITKAVPPKADLILCRDLLVHFSFRDIARALANIKKSGCTYLLTTTFTERRENRDIATGEWRPLNLQRAPFDFPEPLALIVENHPEPRYHDKSLGLWRIADLR